MGRTIIVVDARSVIPRVLIVRDIPDETGDDHLVGGAVVSAGR
jgi:hypothetical protein